jgi:large subunit ribosomal protein L35
VATPVLIFSIRETEHYQRSNEHFSRESAPRALFSRQQESQMPKLKTKSGAKKRFKVTGTGKVMSAHAGKRHGMIKRTKKQIRQLRGTRMLFKTDGDNIKKYFCRTPDRLPAGRSRGICHRFNFQMKDSSCLALNAA